MGEQERLQALAGEWSKIGLGTTEGWALFQNSKYGIEIERIDDPEDGDPMFPDDESAIAFVRMRAKEGSRMHAIAIEIHDLQAAMRGAGIKPVAVDTNESGLHYPSSEGG